MLSKIKISLHDPIWKKILTEMGVVIANDGIAIDLPNAPITQVDLNDILSAGAARHIKSIGAESLTDAEQRLILMLPGSVAELKTMMGYATDAETHSVETLVYNIRQKLGQNFIKRNDGIYRL